MLLARHPLGVLFLLFLFSCDKEPAAPLPNANFFIDNAACASPCYVKFYDQSYSAETWLWDFGNGFTSNKQHDSIQYFSPGLYNVTLSVWNTDNKKDEITKQLTVY
jgi:PKD repeat protein